MSSCLRGKGRLAPVCAALLWASFRSLPAEPLVWKQSGHADFVQGRFGDGGANTYVSAKGRVQLVNHWDLNGDGCLDLVFANSHPHVEKLDAALYWGNGKDFDDSRVTHVPNEGAQWTVAADLDGDGRLDAVSPHYTNGTWSEMDSAVYYGGTGPATGDGGAARWNNPPFARKVSLPTRAAQNAAVGDLNRDGFPDIVFALSAGFWEYRGGGALASPSRIFWGSKDGFRRDASAELEALGASDAAVGDLNGDGRLEIVLANREQAGRFDVPSYVYWGGSEGYAPARRSELPTRQANAVALADVDGDGDTDLLFANGEGPASVAYLNEAGAFRPDARLEFPTSDARDCAAADLNGDGFPDAAFTNHQVSGNPLAHAFVYWGGPQGFSPARRQELETIGAWGLSLADLNADGRIDLVVSNYIDRNLFDVPSYIYWNGPDGFSMSLRTSLFTRGAVGNTVADFNGDGRLDVLFNNTVGRTRGGPNPLYVYWGNPRGEFSPSRRLELPSVEPYGWAAADLNDDDWPELVVANMAEVGRRNTENFIYWGGPDGYSEARRSALVANGARDVSAADLDGNGHLDLVFQVVGPGPGTGILIYWGTADGYVTTDRTHLPGAGTPVPADLNADGRIDLLVAGAGTDGQAAVYWGDGTRGYAPARRSDVPGSGGALGAEVADLNRDGLLDLVLTRRSPTLTSFVYLAEAPGAFSERRRLEFLAPETQGVTVGDVDRDGWLDIVAPCYKDRGSRATLSPVFRGGPDGPGRTPAFLLPTQGGTGSQVADYNRDGHNDLLLICHRSEGDADRPGVFNDHVTDTCLYWGGPDGFRADRKLLIPTRGAHLDSGVDLGSIHDRSNRYDYVSAPFAHGGRAGDRIAWKARTPHGTSVRFQVRTAAGEAALARAPWTGPEGDGSFYTDPDSPLATGDGHSWIQYRAVLTTPWGAGSPILEEVSLSFR